MTPPPPRSTLFPYTTLFRSLRRIAPRLGEAYEALRTLLRPGPLAFTTLLSTASWFLECLCLLLIAHGLPGDRKSTRLNSSHLVISYAVFCLKKKKKQQFEHM